MTDPEITLDESEDELVVGVDQEDISVAVSLPTDADRDSIDEAIETAAMECRHSARILGRSDR